MVSGTGVAQALALAVRDDVKKQLERAANSMFAGMPAGCHSTPNPSHSSNKDCRCMR